MSKSHLPIALPANRRPGSVPGAKRGVYVALPVGLVARLDTLARERGVHRGALIRDFLILAAYR